MILVNSIDFDAKFLWGMNIISPEKMTCSLNDTLELYKNLKCVYSLLVWAQYSVARVLIRCTGLLISLAEATILLLSFSKICLSYILIIH